MLHQPKLFWSATIRWVYEVYDFPTGNTKPVTLEFREMVMGSAAPGTNRVGFPLVDDGRGAYDSHSRVRHT